MARKHVLKFWLSRRSRRRDAHIYLQMRKSRASISSTYADGNRDIAAPCSGITASAEATAAARSEGTEHI